jgi:excisionase family DNA binding protein
MGTRRLRTAAIHPTYLRTAAVAEILHVSPKTVSRWAQEGKLPFLKALGGHRRYPRAGDPRAGRRPAAAGRARLGAGGDPVTQDTTATPTAEAFEHWAVVHLFGRHTVAGRASEQKIAGNDFLRVDIPEVDGRQARTILYSPDAVYDIEAVDEETARLVAAMHSPAEPVTTWTARRMLEETASDGGRELTARQESLEAGLFDDDPDED